MWLKVKDFKGSTLKTIGWIIGIVIYEVITKNIPIWIGGDIPFIQVWIRGDWYPLNKLDTLFYTIASLRLLAAWFGGAFMNIIHLVGGFVIYYWLLYPDGTVGFRGGVDESFGSIKIQILPIFLLYISVYLFLLIFSLYQGWEAYRSECFYPISIENYKLTSQQKQRIADFIDIQSRRKGSVIVSPSQLGKKPKKSVKVKKSK